MEFRLRKGFPGSGSLLPKNEPSYGSVGIKLPKIIAATLDILHLSERLQKKSGLKEFIVCIQCLPIYDIIHVQSLKLDRIHHHHHAPCFRKY